MNLKVVEEDELEVSQILEKYSHVRDLVDQFIVQLRRSTNYTRTAESMTKKTLSLLRVFVGCHKWKKKSQLIKALRGLGRRLILARPLEFSIGGSVRRVLCIVREETAKKVNMNDSMQSSNINNNHHHQLISPTLRRMISGGANNPDDMMNDSLDFQGLRSSVIDAINEQIEELENVYYPIAEQSLKHIHANEVVLVYGQSKSITKFLEYAKEHNRKFEVVVAETSDYSGHTTALELSQIGIPTTLIPDSAIFAMMARVNKVLIGAHAIMASGGVIGQAGTNIVASAAKYHSIPVVCCAGLYKLCPLYPHNQETFNDVVPFAGLPLTSENFPNVRVLSPVFDYVEPEGVSLFVTNTGSYQPSYIYRLLAEYYDADDNLTEGCAQLAS